MNKGVRGVDYNQNVLFNKDGCKYASTCLSCPFPDECIWAVRPQNRNVVLLKVGESLNRRWGDVWGMR